MSTLYRITDWARFYEVADAKKVDGPLSWVAVRTKQDGFGYRRMVAERDRAELFAAWVLILQVAGRQPRADRGKLVRNGRPLDSKGLAIMTGFPEPIFVRALEFFAHPDQSWLTAEVIDDEQPSLTASARAEAPFVEPRESATLPSVSESVRTGPDESSLQDRTGQDNTGQKKETASKPASPAPEGKKVKPDKHSNPEAERFVDWFLALLTETGASLPKLTPSARYGWADAYDKMIRIDGRTKEQVKAVCNWARRDKFWSENFLSPVKLRVTNDGIMKFDFIANKMGGFRPAPKPTPTVPEPPSWREFVTENMPNCDYAPGQIKHGCAWADVERVHQLAIIEGMKTP